MAQHTIITIFYFKTIASLKFDTVAKLSSSQLIGVSVVEGLNVSKRQLQCTISLFNLYYL